MADGCNDHGVSGVREDLGRKYEVRNRHMTLLLLLLLLWTPVQYALPHLADCGRCTKCILDGEPPRPRPLPQLLITIEVRVNCIAACMHACMRHTFICDFLNQLSPQTNASLGHILGNTADLVTKVR